MAKPNYPFAKRQRELLKKQKREEKRQRRTATQLRSDLQVVDVVSVTRRAWGLGLRVAGGE